MSKLKSIAEFRAFYGNYCMSVCDSEDGLLNSVSKGGRSAINFVPMPSLLRYKPERSYARIHAQDTQPQFNAAEL